MNEAQKEYYVFFRERGSGIKDYLEKRGYKMTKMPEKYYVICNGRIIAEKRTFKEAVNHVRSIAWSFDVFETIEIVKVVVDDAKKI